MSEDDVVSFVASSISSIWALELLLLLKRTAPAGRREDELVRELRSSSTAVSEALRNLFDAGLIVEESGLHRYRPAAPMLDRLVSETESLYRLKPATVIKAIIAARA
jgi:predicted transcriptional regulator